jgi:hypothetical protein
MNNYTFDFMLDEKAEETKREIRSRKSKDRQYNGQKKKDNNYLQSTTHKTKEQARRSPLKTGGELRCSRRVSSSRFSRPPSQKKTKINMT